MAIQVIHLNVWDGPASPRAERIWSSASLRTSTIYSTLNGTALFLVNKRVINKIKSHNTGQIWNNGKKFHFITIGDKSENKIQANQWHKGPVALLRKRGVGSGFYRFEVTPYFNHIQIWNFSLKLFKIDCFSIFRWKRQNYFERRHPKINLAAEISRKNIIKSMF